MTMDAAEHAQRRRRVLELLHPGALLVFAAPVALRNHDVEHEYRQDSDLFYLTGLEEPQSALLLSSVKETRFVMFVRPRDQEREVWDGPRAGVEGAVSKYGADVAHPWSELADKLPDLLADTPRLFFDLGRDRAADEQVLSAIARLRARARQGVTWPTHIIELSEALHELRLIKSAREVEAISRAVGVTCEAHLQAMSRAEPGMYEYEIEALIRGHFLRCGSRRCAYPPVVGSGPNTTVLHYRNNDRRLRDGDLLLVDAGCELDYYAADVTRTFPVAGGFSPAQAAVYDVVLEAQTAALAVVRPGATLDEVHQASVQRITAGLIELGIVQGPLPDAVEQERYKPYFMHRTSHFLGMDVHDVGHVQRDGKSRALEQGMVLTVEPGVYIAAGASDVVESYRGIGVRIEDDVLVTADGCQVLSDSLPKRREDIERACSN
jgi:Xaa-Pro aminopeptidase